MLTRDEQHCLLTLARAALEARVRRERPVRIGSSGPDLACGAFVSIHRRGELRGCLGRIESTGPLPELIAHLAEAVADSDPRFQPVGCDELAEVEIEISVLTPERQIQSAEDIDIGRHGVIVEQGGRRGLLLPQVATERSWDRVTFLEHTCRKAGLPPDAWRHGARVLIFEAEVFGEKMRT